MHEKKNTILVVDDEAHNQRMIDILLDHDLYRVIASDSGKQAVRMCISTRPDLVLLDLSLPDMDGTDVIVAMREWTQVPIIVLSSRDSDDEAIAALNSGANDYMTKPFNMDVLRARMRAALRSSSVLEAGEPELHNGGLRMDLVRHEVFIDGVLKPFTPKEYDLLRHFMVNRGKMLGHRDILKKIWGPAHGDDVTFLRVYIGQIRKKIERNPANPSYIKTEPGIGYRMDIIPREGRVS